MPPDLASVLFPQSPPEPANARVVRFPGGEPGREQQDSFAVRDAKQRLRNTIYRARRVREGRAGSGT